MISGLINPMLVRASSTLIPPLASFPTVSHTFTAPMTDSGRMSLTRCEPGSLFSNASSAEASRTYLLTFGLLASFSQQLFDQRASLWDTLPHQSLRPLDRLRPRQNANLSPNETQDHFFANISADFSS